MADQAEVVVVLRDASGDYYLLSRDVIERSRVPAERGAALARLLSEQDARGFGMEGQALAGLPVQPLTVVGVLTSPSARPHASPPLSAET